MSELLFPAPPLANETVLLRPWRETDVPDMAMAFSDPVIQQFSWTAATAFTEDDALAHFASLEPARMRGEGVQFALVEPGGEATQVTGRDSRFSGDWR